jgi:hypothetical protein
MTSCLAFEARVARFLWVKHTKTGENIPNGCKIFQMTLTFPSQGLQIGIFGVKMNVASGNHQSCFCLPRGPMLFITSDRVAAAVGSRF